MNTTSCNQPWTRRIFLSTTAGLAAVNAAPRPEGVLIDTHIHLFDPARFPYHPKATYKPEPQTLENYAKFVREARIDHSVIVHPEPYQDDHRYLEFCFNNEPSKGFFKGTCLFDPIAADTPARMAALVKKWPGRIITMRVHENLDAGKPPTTSGAIRDRDMKDPRMLATWKKAEELGLAVQMHFVPRFAPDIHRLAAQLPKLTVILDHLGRPGQGAPKDYPAVLKLAELPRVIMKYSGTRYVSKDPKELKALVRRVWDAFGPQRIIWGGLGMNMADFEKNSALLNNVFDYATEKDRAAIRGGNAARLWFS
jgi:predicted TIM-barrel fold metal-dependent hydrolase